jgi:competence protein ComEC
LRLPAELPAAPHLLTGALCCGFAAALVVRSGDLWLAVAASVLALVGVMSDRHRVLALALALLLLGVWWGSARLAVLDSSDLAARAGETEVAELVVTGPSRRSEFSTRVPARVRRFGELALDEPVRLELPPRRGLPQGAVLDLVASVRRPSSAAEPGEFDERAYLRRQGVHVVLRASSYRIIGRRGGVGGLADSIRRSVSHAIDLGADGERRALIAGVALGEDEGLEPALRDDFRASGLYHLLAVSGQNVAYVIFGALVAAWALGIPRWLGHVAAIMSVGAYVLAVGWQPSVVRAAVAGSLASLAWLVSRAADRWYFLLVGAALLLGHNPYSALEPGFQLSFAAVAAIFVLVPWLGRRLEGYPVPRRLADVIAVSSACGLVTAPILWIHFGAVPIFSIVANALAAPVVAPLLGLALVSAPLAALAPEAVVVLGWINGWLAAYLAWCARLVGGLPHAQVASGAAIVALAASLVLLAAVRRLPKRRGPWAAGAAVLALAVLGWRVGSDDARPPPTGLRLTFLDVGQGDATLIEVPEGAVLVDGGPPEAKVAQKLRSRGVRRLALLVLTHPSRDNIGGAADVVRELPVDTVLDPALVYENPFGRPAIAAARHRGARVSITRAGQVYRLGRLTLRVLWPEGPGTPSADPNDHATVLLLSYGELDALLPADAESNVTLPLRPPPVEVMKVAHHGSADEGLPELLGLLRPRVAIVSVGRRNDYGHPTPSTLAALSDVADLSVFRTDRHGDVVVESDGRRFAVRSDP